MFCGQLHYISGLLLCTCWFYLTESKWARRISFPGRDSSPAGKWFLSWIWPKKAVRFATKPIMNTNATPAIDIRVTTSMRGPICKIIFSNVFLHCHQWIITTLSFTIHTTGEKPRAMGTHRVRLLTQLPLQGWVQGRLLLCPGHTDVRCSFGALLKMKKCKQLLNCMWKAWDSATQCMRVSSYRVSYFIAVCSLQYKHSRVNFAKF